MIFLSVDDLSFLDKFIISQSVNILSLQPEKQLMNGECIKGKDKGGSQNSLQR